MNLITTAQRQKLLENGRAQRAALDGVSGAMEQKTGLRGEA
jgi:hypothetical protein